MKKIYKITPDPSAPELVLENGIAEKLIGESLIPLSPDKPFRGHVDRVASWNQFYRVGTNAFAVSESAWDCLEVYCAFKENSMEFLAVITPDGYFRIINPMQIASPSDDPEKICDMTYLNAIFRIKNRPLKEVFCLEGLVVPDDEIKRACETYGFTGLIFEEVWRGEQN